MTENDDNRSAPEQVRPGRVRAVVRRVTTTGAGLLGVLAVGAVAAFATTGADRLPETAVADPVERVTVAPAQEVSVCPGPARLTDPETVGDAQFGPAPVGTTSWLRAVLAGDGLGVIGAVDGSEPHELDPATDDGVALATVDDPAAGAVLTVRPGAGEPPRVAASVGSVTTEGDLRGLAAASCSRPGISRWLVGGSTQIGSSAQLVLQNPGLTPATVQVTVWGQGGEAVLAGGGQQLVGPGEELVTLVEAAAPEQRRLVVHVAASGGLVSAYLQHSTLDGLVPLGVDYVVPGAEPAQDLVLAGVESVGEAVDDPHAPQLRLLAPGEGAGVAHVTVYGEDGPVRLRGVEDVALTPGVVTDVSLGGLPAGRYAVAVHADVPVVAGASLDRRGERDPDLLHEERQYDRAWIAAQPAAGAAGDSDGTGRAGQVALVPGTSSSLTLAAVPTVGGDGAGTEGAEGAEGATGGEAADVVGDGELDLEVRVYDEDGAVLGEKTVTVAAGSTRAFNPWALRPEGSDARPAAVTVDVVRATRDVAPVWALTASAGPPSGDEGDRTPSLVSVLLPVTDAPAPHAVGVRASTTAGLGS